MTLAIAVSASDAEVTSVSPSVVALACIAATRVGPGTGANEMQQKVCDLNMPRVPNREHQLRDRLTRVLVDELERDAALALASEWAHLITADLRRVRATRRRLALAQETSGAG
jgi:hypothetical protein